MAKSKTTRRSSTRKPSAPAGIDVAIATARSIVDPNTAPDVVAKFNAGYTTATRNVGRFTGMRVVAFQNHSLVANADWQLDDVQLAALWSMEFPMAVGRVFALNGRMGTPDPIRTAIGIVRGVRAEYNRNGHGDPAIPNGPKTPVESYGAKRFDIRGPETAKPVNVADAKLARRTA